MIDHLPITESANPDSNTVQLVILILKRVAVTLETVDMKEWREFHFENFPSPILRGFSGIKLNCIQVTGRAVSSGVCLNQIIAPNFGLRSGGMAHSSSGPAAGKREQSAEWNYFLFYQMMISPFVGIVIVGCLWGLD